MTDTNEPVPAEQTSAAPPPYDAGAVPATPVPAAPVAGFQPIPATGPVGKVRGTGACIGLTVVTLGFYTWYWYYKTHEEMKRHSGEGIGGPVALILAIFISIVNPFLSSSEVGKLYQRDGRPAPVSAATGLWFLLLGWLFFVGAIVWFVKTNGALNEYWKSKGAQA